MLGDNMINQSVLETQVGSKGSSKRSDLEHLLFSKTAYHTTEEKPMTEQSLNVTCPLCGSQHNQFNISDPNLRFLLQRFDEKTLDDAITLSAIAWNNFPALKLTADSKTVINGLLKGIENQVSKAVAPLDKVIMMIQPLSQKLEGLTAKLPEDLRKEFNEINGQLTSQIKTMQDVAKGVAEPVQRDVRELSLSINAMDKQTYKLGNHKRRNPQAKLARSFCKRQNMQKRRSRTARFDS